MIHLNGILVLEKTKVIEKISVVAKTRGGGRHDHKGVAEEHF